MIRVEPARRDSDEMAVRVNQIMDQMLQKSFFKFRPCENWQPAINFYESEGSYFVCVDLGGVDPSQVALHVDSDTLRISGHRPAPSPEGVSGTRIHVMEIDHGPFGRSIQIPQDSDVDRIEARHRNGLLWIVIPKRDA